MIFRKSNLKTGHVVTFRNQEQGVVILKSFTELDGEDCYIANIFSENDIIFSEISDDLTCTTSDSYDIVKVEEPGDITKVFRKTYTGLFTIYERGVINE